MPTIDEAYHNIMNTKYKLGEDFPKANSGIEGVPAYDLSKSYSLQDLINFRTDHCFGIVDNQGRYYHLPDFELTKHEDLVNLLIEKGIDRSLLTPHIKVNSGIQYFDRTRGDNFCPTMTVDNMDESIPELTYPMCYALKNLLLYTPRSSRNFQSKLIGNVVNIGLNYAEQFSEDNLDGARLKALTNIRKLDGCINERNSESLFEASEVRDIALATYRLVKMNKVDTETPSGQGDGEDN